MCRKDYLEYPKKECRFERIKNREEKLGRLFFEIKMKLEKIEE